MKKKRYIQSLTDTMAEIPDYIYDLWTQIGGRPTIKSVRMKYNTINPSRRETFGWILANMDIRKDPAYRKFIQELRDLNIEHFFISFCHHTSENTTLDLNRAIK